MLGLCEKKEEKQKTGGPVQKLVRRHQFSTNSPQEFYIVFYTELYTISWRILSSFVTQVFFKPAKSHCCLGVAANVDLVHNEFHM